MNWLRNLLHRHKWESVAHVRAIDAGEKHWGKPDIFTYKCSCGCTLIKRGDFKHVLPKGDWEK